MEITATEAGLVPFTPSASKGTGSAPLKWREVKQAIRRDARLAGVHCSHNQANELREMIVRVTRRSRRHHQACRLFGWELRRFHDVLAAIMPVGQMVAPPGSAHDLANRYFTRGNVVLVHICDDASICNLRLVVVGSVA